MPKLKTITVAKESSDVVPYFSGDLAYDRMRADIFACHSVNGAKELRNKARTLETYAKQIGDKESEEKFHEIRFRIERLAGELLKAAKDNGEIRKGNPQLSHRVIIAKLPELGITLNQSSNWQRMAEIPEERFEKLVKMPGQSTHGIIASTKPIPETPPVPMPSLTFWGHLRDIERVGLLDHSVDDLVSDMLPTMQKDCARLIPRILEWLCKSSKASKI